MTRTLDVFKNKISRYQTAHAVRDNHQFFKFILILELFHHLVKRLAIFSKRPRKDNKTATVENALYPYAPLNNQNYAVYRLCHARTTRVFFHLSKAPGI